MPQVPSYKGQGQDSPQANLTLHEILALSAAPLNHLQEVVGVAEGLA